MKHRKKIKNYCMYIRNGSIWLLLVGCIVSAGAQALYSNKGFVFQHPYFENKTWLSSLNTIDVVASPRLLNSVPSAISYSGTADKSAVVYISNDSLYLSVTSLFETGTSCYKKELVFILPKHVQSPVSLNSQTALYAIKNESVDTIEVCLGSSNGTIYLLKISTLIHAVIDSSSIILSNGYDGRITSITGSSTSYLSGDTGIWITGSKGLLRFVSYNQALLGSEVIYDVDSSETVLCYGEDFAATESGTIYAKSGNSFVKVHTASHAIRTIDGNGAAGDGVVAVYRAGVWKEVYSGSTSFMGHNITANADGVLCELIDTAWECDTLIDGNSPTLITSVLPDSYVTYMNNQTTYLYNVNKPETLTVFLADSEKNYQLPEVTRRSGSQTISLNTDGKYTLQNADPSQFCVNKNLALSDSVFRVILYPDVISVEASAQLGVVDLVCEECVLKAYSFKRIEPWRRDDTLTIQMASQKLTVINGSGSVTNVLNRFTNKKGTFHLIAGKSRIKLHVPFTLVDVKEVHAFNLYGKVIPFSFTGNCITIKHGTHQLVTLRIKLSNGTYFTKKITVLE